MTNLFLRPVDVLYLRGNKLFGAPGDDALAQMPPWPSLAAGAIRSRMLVDHQVNLHDFAKGNAVLSDSLAEALGTPKAPGSFRITHFGLAKREYDHIAPLLPFPADVVAFKDREEHLDIIHMKPQPLPNGVIGAKHTPCLPVLKMDKQRKPESGYWLTNSGIAAYVRGETLQPSHLIHADELWKTDPRLGIALDGDQHTAAQGKIYTTDVIAMRTDVGFVVTVAGASELVPTNGLLRFGGDGRAASVQSCSYDPLQPDWNSISQQRRFKLVLRSPGIFEHGWQLPGMQSDGRWHCGFSGSARLVAAAVSRNEVISGWNIARHQPKPAQRTVPTGSVYWLDDWQGDMTELKQVVLQGLPCDDPSRRAEGFNHCMITNWKGDDNV